ncbi:hypothetical protein Hanom_Chr06g00526591 [Helianthus anomalus]
MPREKAMIEISTPHKMLSSLAFVNKPQRRLEKVTRKSLAFSTLAIWIFWRPLLFLGNIVE